MVKNCSCLERRLCTILQLMFLHKHERRWNTLGDLGALWGNAVKCGGVKERDVP